MTSHENLIIKTCEVCNQPTKEEILLLINNYYNEKEKYLKNRDRWEDWQTALEDEVGEIFYSIIKNERNLRKNEWASLEDGNSFTRTHPQSINWEVLNILSTSYNENLLPEDLPYLRKFLLTPPGKELEGWAEWEAYWESRHPVQK